VRVDLEAAAKRISVSEAGEVEEKIGLTTGSRVDAGLATIDKSLNPLDGLGRTDDAQPQSRGPVGL